MLFRYVVTHMMPLKPQPATETLMFRVETLHDFLDIYNLTTTLHLFHDNMDVLVAHLENEI